MSPIGRVFIVINLILAGVFLGFSGYYLQQTTSWKKKHTEDCAKKDAEIAKKDGEIKAANDGWSVTKASLARSEQENTQLKSEKVSLDEENKNLKGELTNIGKHVADANQNISTINATLAGNSKDSKEMRDKFLAAEAEKATALQSKVDAEAKLADAQQQVADLTTKLNGVSGELTAKSEENRALGIQIALYKEKLPGLGAVMPKIDGRVMAVNANLKLVTVSVGSENAEMKPGYEMAIYAGNQYKGEMVVTDVTDRIAHGRITKVKDGVMIAEGDMATTRFQ